MIEAHHEVANKERCGDVLLHSPHNITEGQFRAETKRVTTNHGNMAEEFIPAGNAFHLHVEHFLYRV